MNADLRVGELNETITVTGETPVVDVQNARQQTVMGSEVLNTIPTGRTQFANAVLVPGISSSFQDVGGANNLAAAASSLTIHGSRGGDQRVTVAGVPMANLELSGNSSNFVPNMGSVQEMTVDIGAGTAEQETGGVRMNLIPREGGNSFSGSFFATAANSSFQGSNYDDDLKARGLRTPDEIKLNYDFNPAFGGPLVQDKVWFFSAARFVKNENYVGGVLANLNAGDPTKWLYQADPDTRGIYNLSQEAVNTRVTWQANQRNKVSFFYDHQWRCWCRRTNVNVSPESASTYHFPGLNMSTVTWTSPVTNRLLIEASFSRRGERFIVVKPDSSDVFANLIPVVEQSSGLVYRGLITNNSDEHPALHRQPDRPGERLASVSYVTGAHAFKFGFGDNWGTRDVSLDSPGGVGLMYRFNNGVPNQLTAVRDAVQNAVDAGLQPRHLRAGQVDAEPADAERRPAVRLHGHLVPRAVGRTGPAGAEPERLVSGAIVVELEGPGAAPRRRLRSLRQRQDGASRARSTSTWWPRACRVSTAPTRFR